MKVTPTILLGVLLCITGCVADRIELKSEIDKINYSVGYQIGGDFKQQGLGINPDALAQGLRDAFAGGDAALTAEEMRATLVNLKKKLVAEQQIAQRQSDAAFLAANAKQDGVTVLPSGVQYSVLHAGTGKLPTLQENVSIRYRVIRSDGQEIGNSGVDAPKTYPLAKAAPGLREALQLMPEGSKWRIVVPPALASDDREAQNSVGILIYELELISVQPAT